MKSPAVPAVAAVAAVVVSAGCGGQPKPAAESSAFVSRATSVAAPSTPVGRGETPSRDFVIGKWGTDGDCTLAIDLRADGTSDGPFGDWTYSDGVISFPDAPELAVNVMILDDTTMQSINDSSGKTSKMTRCP